MPVRAQTTPAFPDPQQADAPDEDLLLKSGSTGMVSVAVHDKQVLSRGDGETAS